MPRPVFFVVIDGTDPHVRQIISLSPGDGTRMRTDDTPITLRHRLRDAVVHARHEWDAARRTLALRWRWRRRRPSTYNEKIRCRMAMDHSPLLKTFVDKIAVRDYVAEMLGPAVLPPVHLVTDDPRDIDLSGLPRKFALKPTHGSGSVLLVHDRADADAEIPSVSLYPVWGRHQIAVRRDRVDPSRLHRLCRHWLRTRYHRWEWAYRQVPPRLMVEDFLGDGDTPPADYKFFVVDGEVRSVLVMGGRTRQMTCSLLRPDWTPEPVRMTYPVATPLPPRPANLDRMMDMARELGRDTDMVRVDLYDVDGQVYFGELTPYPGGGQVVFDPPEYDATLLADWQPRRGRR